jgi:hypothetical protein
MKMAAFWDVAACSVVQLHRRFSGAFCLHHQDDDGIKVSKLVLLLFVAFSTFLIV